MFIHKKDNPDLGLSLLDILPNLAKLAYLV